MGGEREGLNRTHEEDMVAGYLWKAFGIPVSDDKPCLGKISFVAI